MISQVVQDAKDRLIKLQDEIQKDESLMMKQKINESKMSIKHMQQKVGKLLQKNNRIGADDASV